MYYHNHSLNYINFSTKMNLPLTCQCWVARNILIPFGYYIYFWSYAQNYFNNSDRYLTGTIILCRFPNMKKLEKHGYIPALFPTYLLVNLVVGIQKLKEAMGVSRSLLLSQSVTSVIEKQLPWNTFLWKAVLLIL